MKKNKLQESNSGTFLRKFLTIMKLSIFIICVSALSVLAAGSYSQTTKLSLQAQNSTIEHVLKQIEDQSEYRFFYTEKLNMDKRIDTDFENSGIKEVLNRVFKDTNIDYKIVGRQVALFSDKDNYTDFEMQQARDVTGKVTDPSGQPLPGVSIVVKGTTKGTITSFDGNFILKDIPPNAVLVYSFIGMKTQEVPVAGQSFFDIVMEEDAIGVDEVVVTALGIKRQAKKVGYAVTEVKGEELAAVNTVNAVQALQGKAAGLSIGTSDGGLFGNSKIQIRGVSVLNSNNNQPIFVVDGAILDNSVSNASADWSASSNDFGNILKNLNAEDFESVSVLKGAAATALYGSRGINGAIVIQTKDGKGTRGLGVRVTQSIGIDHVFNQPNIQYVFGPGAIAGYTGYGETDADGNYYRFSTNQFYLNEDGIPTKQGHPWDWSGFGPRYDGRPMIDYDGSMTTYSPAKNNLVNAYENGFSSNTTVAISGGTERGTFYLSDTYTHRTGVFPGNEFDKNSLQFSGSYKLADWLTAQASVSFVTSIPKNPRNDLAENFTDGDWPNWYDPAKWKHREIWQAPHGGTPSSAFGDENTHVPGNGVWFAYNMNESAREEQVTRPIVSLTANLTDWLSVKAEANMNYYTIEYEQKNLGSGYANEGGYYELRHDRNVSKTGKVSAMIDKQLTDDLSTNIVLGGEIWEQENSYTRVRTDGGLIVPGKFFLGNSKKTLLSEGRVRGTKQINSLYFLANFGWKDQLYLDVTGRNDWSSALMYSNGTGNYSYFYPSVSSSWLFTETFQMPSWFSFGKLRLSWAQVGNDTSPYFLNRGYSQSRYELPGGDFAYTNTRSTTTVDLDIKPERKNSFEVGLDARFFNNRLGVDFAYFDDKTDNQIGELPIPEESGVNRLIANVGSIKTYGIDLTLSGSPIKTRNFEWELTFNYWDNTTKITELHEDFGEYRVLSGSVAYGNYRIGSVAFEGGEYGILKSDIKPLEWKSEDPNDPRNGMPVFQWSDTRRGAFYKRSFEVQDVGKITPDFEGSLNTRFQYKNLTLSVLLDARFGGHIASYPNRYGTAYGWLETSLKWRDTDFGGISWTSGYADIQGQQFTDGIIPYGVFDDGQMVTAPSGEQVDVGGMTYQEAYDAGHVEPTHATFYHYFTNSWGQGVINDSWFNEVEYIALRNISVGYNLPKSIANKIKAENVYLSFNARNLGYLHNNMANNMNPENFRGTTSSGTFLQRSVLPYTATYTMTVAVDF